MRCREITTEIFAIESRDHPEIWCLRQVQWVTDRNDRGRYFQSFGFSNRQRRSGRIDLQHGGPAADVCQKLTRRVFFTAEFNCEISRFASNRVRRVKRPCGIDEKSSPANCTVVSVAVFLHTCFWRRPENVVRLRLTDCSVQP